MFHTRRTTSFFAGPPRSQSAKPRLKPERVERGFFRSAEAFLPRMNAGLPPKFEQPPIEARELSDVLMGRLVLLILI